MITRGEPTTSKANRMGRIISMRGWYLHLEVEWLVFGL